MNSTSSLWSSDEIATVVAMYSSTSAPEIGKLLGRTAKSVYHVVVRLGLHKTPEQVAAIQRTVPRAPGFIKTQFKKLHGLSIEKDGKRSPTYTAWRSMRARCALPTRRDWQRYGGRGIRVCSRWDSFSLFLSDMGTRPPNSSLGRINNDGQYEPSNCRWETNIQQARNRCTNVFVHAFGKSQCVAQWAEEYGIRSDTLHYRLKHGMSPEVALTKPVDQRCRRKKGRK